MKKYKLFLIPLLALLLFCQENMYAYLSASSTSINEFTLDTSKTISFNGNGGTDGTAITKFRGKELGTLPTSTRTGYIFDGWYTADGSNITSSTKTPAEDTIYYAHWTPITYTIHFVGDSGISFNDTQATGSMDDMSMVYDTEKKLPANGFKKENHEFLGWSTNSFASTVTYADQESVINLSSTDGDVVTLYAVWKQTRISFTVDGKSFSTTPGITWNEWISSDDNTSKDKFKIVDGYVYYSRFGNSFTNLAEANGSSMKISAASVIKDGKTYYRGSTSIDTTSAKEKE